MSISSVQFSHSVVSDSFQPHGLQHTRLSCPSPILELAQTHVHWVGDAISSSVIPFSSCPQSFPASGSFLMSQFFTAGGQSIGASASASIPPMNIQGWFPLGLVDLISLQSKEHSTPILQHTYKASILWHSAFFIVQRSHSYMTTGKPIALTTQTFVGKVLSLLLNTMFRLTFFPRSKHLLISWLQSPSAVILEPKKIKSVSVSTLSPSICHEVMGLDAMILVFWMLSFKPTFHPPFSPSSRSSLVPFCFLPLELVLSAYLRLLIFLPGILIPACASSSLAFCMIYPA